MVICPECKGVMKFKISELEYAVYKARGGAAPSSIQKDLLK